MLESTSAAMSDDQGTSNNSGIYQNGNPSESFDDLDFAAEPNSDRIGDEGKDDDWGKDPEPKSAKKEEVSEDLKILNDSDGTEEKKDAKADKKDAGKDAKSVEDDGEEDTKEAKSDDKSELPTGKDADGSKGKVRIRVGEDIYGLEPSTAVRVKVDGAYQDVPISDLVNNYAGKVAYDKKFSEVANQRKEVEGLKAQVAHKDQYVQKVIGDVRAIVSDKTKDPFEAINYLAELAGVSTVELYKRSMETRLDEVSKLLDMTDVERENYFLKKETDYLRNRSEARAKEELQAVESRKFTDQVDQLRGKHNVSEDQFVEAMDELEQLYGDDPNVKLTPEFVVEYAVQRPYLNKSKELVMPFAEEIGEAKLANTIHAIANMMRQYGIKEDALKAELEARFSVTKGVKDLNDKLKAKKVPAKESKSEQSEKLESFDDFEF